MHMFVLNNIPSVNLVSIENGLQAVGLKKGPFLWPRLQQ